MIFDWLLYGLLTWGLAATLNATFFKEQRATRFAAWGLTIPLFLVNVFALSALKVMRYYVMSESLGKHRINPCVEW